jgi:putative ABC transport system permease protein
MYAGVILQGTVISLGAGLAAVIGALGLFGLSAHSAEQRTKEIGIRKAMGARRRDILVLLIWQFAKPVLWANLIAMPFAWFFMRRWLHGFVYHIDLSPLDFATVGALALLIALATVVGHALHVARAKPIEALRYE